MKNSDCKTKLLNVKSFSPAPLRPICAVYKIGSSKELIRQIEKPSSPKMGSIGACLRD